MGDERKDIVVDDVMRATLDVLVKLCKPDYICDIGCCNAWDTLRFSKASPTSKIIAFEASSRNYKRFLTNNSDFKDRNVVFEHKAVSDVDGQVEFHVLDFEDHEITQGHWKFAASSLLNRVDEFPYKTEIVDSVRLDSYFSNVDLSDKTFVLWIDIEGVLDKVLSGGEIVFSRTLAFRAEVEWEPLWENQVLAPELISRIEAMGFCLMGDSRCYDSQKQSDLLFIKRNILRHLVLGF